MAFEFKLYQLNCHHSRIVHTSLEADLPDQTSFICLLQEPYLYEGNVCGLDKNRVHYMKNVSSRVAIYVSTDLKLTYHEDLSSRDCVTCSIRLDGQSYFFSSIYLHKDKSVEDPMWSKTVTRCHQTDSHFMAGLDSNAHSQLWGSPANDGRGLKLEDFLFGHNLCLLNEGNSPTFETGVGKTCIDLTVASPQLATCIRDWQVHDEMHLSDHHLITANVRLRVDKPDLGWKRNYKQADWSRFQNLVQNKLSAYEFPLFWTKNRVDDVTNYFNNALIQSLDEVAPLRFYRGKSSKLRWFTPELDSLRKETRKAHNAARRNNCADLWDVYLTLRQQFKAECRKARHKSWQAFTSETINVKLASRLNRILQKNARHEVSLIKLPGGTLTDSIDQSYQVLMKEHFPGCIYAADNHINLPTTPGIDLPQLLDPISWIDHERVIRALSLFGDHKGAGPDGLKPIVLKHLPQVAINFIVVIYTAMIRLHYTPKLWRSIIVVFIAKVGKASYVEKRSFRPISLMPFLFKGLERLAQWNIEQIAQPFHSKQYAYRKGISSESALSGLVNTVERAIMRGKIALAVFLDIEGAFDNATAHAIEKGMQNHGVDIDTIQWFINYLNNRVAVIRNQKGHYQLKKGTGQGGVLSPTVWNFIMDTFLSQYDKGRVEAFAFADDGALVIVASSLPIAVRLMQKALHKASKWAKQNKLKFSAHKTEAVIFTKKNGLTLPVPLTLDGQAIKVVKEARYLGVKLHYKLRWVVHIKAKIAAAKRHLMSIRQGIGSAWGPPPHINLWLYTGIVRPALTYGSVVWAQAAASAYMQKELSKVQRLGLTMLAPMRPSTPTSGLEMVLGVPPLDLHIRELAISSLNRLNLQPSGWNGSSRRRQGHIVWLKDQMDGLPPRELQDRCAIPITTHKFSVIIAEGDDDITTPGIRLYTDGSNSNKTGAGFVAFHDPTEDPKFQGKSFLGQATVFQAEVHAIEGAAEYAAANNFDQVTIFSDCQSALHAISSHLAKSRTVFNAIKALNRLGSTASVQLRWIRGHAGHFGNELADMLAKDASHMVVEGPEPILPLPSSVVRAAARQQTIDRWTARWEHLDSCRQTRIFFPTPNKKFSKELLHLGRHDLGLCIRHLTGHSFFKYHRSKVDPLIDPQCRLCGFLREESAHIILDCPRFQEMRFQIFFEYAPATVNTVWQLSLFLNHPDISVLEEDTESDED